MIPVTDSVKGKVDLSTPDTEAQRKAHEAEKQDWAKKYHFCWDSSGCCEVCGKQIS